MSPLPPNGRQPGGSTKSTGHFGHGGRGQLAQPGDDGEISDAPGRQGLPVDGRMTRDGSGQPNSQSPSVSQTGGLKARPRRGSGRPHNQTGFDKSREQGTLANDIAMKRMGPSFMLKNRQMGGSARDTNRPSQLPSHHTVKHGNDDHKIANQKLDHARKANSTAAKRGHLFGALTALNSASRKEAKSLRTSPAGGQATRATIQLPDGIPVK